MDQNKRPASQDFFQPIPKKKRNGNSLAAQHANAKDVKEPNFQLALCLVIDYLPARDRIKCERVSRICQRVSLDSWAHMNELLIDWGKVYPNNLSVPFRSITQRLKNPVKIHTLILSTLTFVHPCQDTNPMLWGPHFCGDSAARRSTGDEVNSMIALNSLKLPNLKEIGITIGTPETERVFLRFVKAHPTIEVLHIGCDQLCKHSGRQEVKLADFVTSLPNLGTLQLEIPEQAFRGPPLFLPNFSYIRRLLLIGNFTFKHFDPTSLSLPFLTDIGIVDEPSQPRHYSAPLHLTLLASRAPNVTCAFFELPTFFPKKTDFEGLETLPLVQLSIKCDITGDEAEFAECLNRLSDPGALTKQTLLFLDLQINTTDLRKLFALDFCFKRFSRLLRMTGLYLSARDEKRYTFDMARPFWEIHVALMEMCDENANWEYDFKGRCCIPCQQSPILRKRRLSGSSLKEKGSDSRERRISR